MLRGAQGLGGTWGSGGLGALEGMVGGLGPWELKRIEGLTLGSKGAMGFEG